MRALLLFAVLVSSGCLRKTEYKCTESTQCGAGGTCEDIGFCSFADSMCTSGRRFGEYSGTSFSNKCTGETGIDIDGGPGNDGPGTPDSELGDALLGNCPASYVAITGGGTRRYRVITATAAWAAHETDCGNDTAGTNSYLATPNDQAELTAIVNAAAVAQIWVGVNDIATEGTYATTAGGTIPSNDPMWAGGEPDGGGGQDDCVSADMAGARLADNNCPDPYAAVCECEP